MIKKKDNDEKPEIERDLSDPSFWNRPFISRKVVESNRTDEDYPSFQEYDENLESDDEQDLESDNEQDSQE